MAIGGLGPGHHLVAAPEPQDHFPLNLLQNDTRVFWDYRRPGIGVSGIYGKDSSSSWTG